MHTPHLMHFVRLLLLLVLFAVAAQSWAGQFSKSRLEQHLKKRFGNEYVLGEQLSNPPAWPLFSKREGRPELAAWLFESIDVQRVRGYSGKPINLLITLAPDGRFLDVTLHKHAEPIFKSRSGTKDLEQFSAQYNELSIDHEVQILAADATPDRTETTASLHGIVRGTVTAAAIDRTVMWTAVRVVEAHLASSGALAADSKAQAAARRRHRRMDWAELKDKGLVRQVRHSDVELGAALAKSGVSLPLRATESQSEKAAIDYWLIPIALPAVGRSLLEPRGWQIMERKIKQGRNLLLMVDSGSLALTDAEGIGNKPGVVPILRQAGQNFPLEQTQFRYRLPPDDSSDESKVRGIPRLFQTAADSGFDLARPFSLLSQPALGELIYHEAAFEDAVAIADIERWMPRAAQPAWLAYWERRRVDLFVLGLGLIILTAGLIAQRRLALTARRLAWFRTGYLLFTLFFIGWYAQGQLTIVTILAALQAAVQGQDVGFMLTDPMAVTLWVFVGITLLVWGRGTFCGWLCPFGALQELINTVAAWFGLKRRQLHTRLNAHLRWLKYIILTVLLLAALVAPSYADWLAEIEPFKTTISMGFQRSWPYVAWALACLALTLVVYRGFCRYLCPLGAALAVLGRIRLFTWIPRRQACGTPCQTCRFRCTYQAIEPTGRVSYSECFQCLDCVSIYHDDRRCMPLIVERKREKRPTIPITAHG